MRQTGGGFARRGHAPPPAPFDQPLRPGRGGRWRGDHRTSPEARSARSAQPRQGGGGGGFVTVNERLFAPLQGLSPNDILQGGYGWLSPTDNGMTLHPGLDLNTQGGCSADEGNLVVAPLAGIVRATLFWNQVTPGEGNHVWVELDDPCCPGPTFFHVDHLGIISVSENQRLAPGEPIGTCSSSGGWACAHAHVELTKGSPPNGWYTWPYSWSRAQVEAAYHNPHAWWDAATALVFAEAGGVTPPSPEVITMILNGAQQAAVQAALWGDYWNPAMADFALPTAWRDEWKAGRYRGRPLSGEEDIPASEDKPAGKFQVFELGVACWLEHHPVSWNG